VELSIINVFIKFKTVWFPQTMVIVTEIDQIGFWMSCTTADCLMTVVLFRHMHGKRSITLTKWCNLRQNIVHCGVRPTVLYWV